MADTPRDDALRHDPAFRMVPDIRYSDAAGEKGVGDLFVPAGVARPRTILLIHGGGWKAMVRHRVQHVAAFLARLGYAVFNISYRLLPEAPYPACQDDCLAAARFVLETDHRAVAPLNRETIVVGGFSAGGHLALMTGLNLPREQVAGIIDGCGPTELLAPEMAEIMNGSGMFAERHDRAEALQAASPTTLASGRQALPPLLVLHCQRDSVVPVQQAYRIIKSWNAAEADVQAFLFSGPGERGHDIWCNPKPELHPKLEQQIATFLATFFTPTAQG